MSKEVWFKGHIVPYQLQTLFIEEFNDDTWEFKNQGVDHLVNKFWITCLHKETDTLVVGSVGLDDNLRTGLRDLKNQLKEWEDSRDE